MGRIWNGKPGTRGGPVIGRRSPYTGIQGGRGLQRSGKVSWVPGNTQYAGFAKSHNAYGGRISDGLVSIWYFGEGDGVKLHDVTPLTFKQDLTWAPPGFGVTVNMAWKYSDTHSRWCGAFEASGIGDPPDYEPTDDSNLPTGRGELYYEMESQRAAAKINQFSVEAWVDPSSITQSPYKVIFGMTLDGDFHNNYNYILAQSASGSAALGTDVGAPSSCYSIAARVNDPIASPANNFTGVKFRTTASGVAKTQLQHLVMTVKGEDAGPRLRLWVDGKLEINYLDKYHWTDDKYDYTAYWVAPSPTTTITHEAWCTKVGRSYDFSSVGLPEGWNDWEGDIYLIATYDHALNKGEVLTNYNAGIVNNPPPALPTINMVEPLTSILHNCSACNQTQYPPTTTLKVDADTFRVVPINVNYSLSSPDGLVEGTDYADVTPHGYATIAGKDWEADITLSANPSSLSSGDIHITLSSVSIGSLGSTVQHIMSMAPYDGEGYQVSGYGDRTLLADYVSSLPIPFTLVSGTDTIITPNSYEISASIHVSGHPSNILSYSVTPSTIVFEPGKVHVSNNMLAPTTINPWQDADSIRLIVSSAESDSSFTVSANVDEVITISNDISFNKPGPGNTGCRIPDYQLKDPNDAWWYDSVNNFVSANPGIITGYKFNQAVLSTPTSATHGLFFMDCVFDGRDANGVDSIDMVIVGDDTNRSQDLDLMWCTVRNAKTTLISGCTIRRLWKCDFFESGYGGVHGLGASAGCIISDNWIHQIGRKKDFGGIGVFAISLWGATSGATITGNYVDTRSTQLWDCDPITGVIGPGTSINCHAPHVEVGCDAAYDDYTPNGCLEVRSLKDNVSGTVTVSGNWFAGWETCHVFGKWDQTKSYDASVTISLNRYERDFTGEFIVVTQYDPPGFIYFLTDSETWEDTGVDISDAFYYGNDTREWSLFACEFYQNCAPGSYDPDLDCSYYC